MSLYVGHSWTRCQTMHCHNAIVQLEFFFSSVLFCLTFGCVIPSHASTLKMASPFLSMSTVTWGNHLRCPQRLILCMYCASAVSTPWHYGRSNIGWSMVNQILGWSMVDQILVTLQRITAPSKALCSSYPTSNPSQSVRYHYSVRVKTPRAGLNQTRDKEWGQAPHCHH